MSGLELRDNGGRRLGGRPVVGTAPTDGQVLTWVNANSRWEPASGSGVAAPASQTNGFRLTLTSGTPVTTADVTAATTIYLTPFRGNTIGLYDGTNWIARSSAEVSLALGTLSGGLPHDVFAYWTGSAVALEFVAWTNDTTRATSLTRVNGVWTKTGDATRRYVGTFRAVTTTTTEDSRLRRNLFNAENRVLRTLFAREASIATHTYTTATWRAHNANTTDGEGAFRFMLGLAEEGLSADARVLANNSTGGVTFAIGIGIDRTDGNDAQFSGAIPASGGYASASAAYRGSPGVGFHYAQLTQYSVATGTTTWYQGGDGVNQNGLVGAIMA